MSIPITPKTKVGALLEAYPGIENQLAAWVPAFQKLHNPVLRRTVAKVVSLEQAASVGGIAVGELVARLRRYTGQAEEPLAETESMAEHKPDWLSAGRVIETIDAAAILDGGDNPIGRVSAACARLKPGELVQVTSAFRPQPLIDTMRKAGFQVYSAPTAGGASHETWFSR